MPYTGRALTMIVGFFGAVFVTAWLLRAGAPWSVAVPAPIGLALPAWYRWDRRHELRQDRKSKGQCLRCGYGLRGNVSGVCPECGGQT